MRLKKPLKIIGIIVGSIFALLVILAIALMVLVDPNKYRDQIVGAVKTHTGRDLKIEGDLKLSFFPWIGLETGALELSNAAGFGPEPFARVGGAAIKVELMPLLRKQVRVDGIRLHALKLHLARAANGRTNWDDLVKKKPDEKPEPQASESDPAAALGALTINRIEVTNSEFTWRDQTSGASYALRNVNLTSGNVLSDKPVPLALAFDFESGQPKIAKRVQLDARLNLDAAKETLDVPELKLALGDLRLQGKVRGTDVFASPKLAGQIEIPAFAPRALLKEFGVAYAPADTKALNKLALNARFEYSAQATSLPELRITLDDTQITGKLTLQTQPRTAYRGELNINAIDVDRYLPAASNADNKGEKPAEKAAPAPAAGPAVIPLTLLRDTDADAQLKIQQLKAFGIRSEQVVVKVNARNGRITLGPNSAKLYNGSYAGQTVADVSGKTPRFEFKEKLDGVQLGPFLKDAGVFGNFSGQGNVQLALTAQGFAAPDIKKTLNGSVAVAIKDGAIEGFDFLKIEAKTKELKQAEGGSGRNLMEGVNQLRPTSGDKTPFGQLQASATVTNGIASNKDLVVEAPKLRITGNGNLNLITSSYENYRLTVNNLPFTMNGPFASTYPMPDAKALVQKEIEKGKQELNNKANEQVEKWLQKRLKK